MIPAEAEGVVTLTGHLIKPVHPGDADMTIYVDDDSGYPWPMSCAVPPAGRAGLVGWPALARLRIHGRLGYRRDPAHPERPGTYLVAVETVDVLTAQAPA